MKPSKAQVEKITKISDLMTEKLFPEITGLKEVFCVFQWSGNQDIGYAVGVQIWDKKDGDVIGYTIVESESLEKMELGILEEIEKVNKPDSYYDSQFNSCDCQNCRTIH